MMRNPLSRRMFTNPQQRRQMSRMPSGILASGPNVMRAAMQQEPVKMRHGGYHPPALPQEGSGINIIDFLNKNILGPNLQIGGSSTQQEGATGTSTSSTSSPKPKPKPKQVVLGQVTDQPAALNTFSTAVPGEVRPDLNLTSRKKPDSTVGSEVTGRLGALDALLKNQDSKNKTTKEYIDDAKNILKEYGIEAPDLKSRRDMRIMEFFLNMAAGQSPDAATNVAQAAQTSVKGYGEDVRDFEEAEQKLALAGVEMGLTKEAREEAKEQAILLKKYDIAADIFDKINDIPDKSQQIKVLMDQYDVGQEDAIKMVYPGRTSTSQYGDKRQDLIDDGHSPLGATYLALGGATLLGQLADGTSMLGDQLAKLAKEQGVTLTPLDKSIFNIPSDDIDLTS